jgi:coenzyme PQQ precursor peptide PqqA
MLIWPAHRRPVAAQQDTRKFYRERIRWRTFNHGIIYYRGRNSSPLQRRAKMAWKTPKIVEVPCGMEINMYVSATRK